MAQSIGSIESAVAEYYSGLVGTCQKISGVTQMRVGVGGLGGLVDCDYCLRLNDIQNRTNCEGCGAPLSFESLRKSN